MAHFQTAPDSDNPRMPGGIPYIVGNEAAERFSYYGMKAILVIFMANYVLNFDGTRGMSEAEAKTYYHLFGMAAYFFPILGAILADVWLGKYRTILVLSLVYCAGHAALAIRDDRAGLLVGLTLIAIGSGGIKPCVSAHVGDQFGKNNQHLLTRVFQWFYFAINFGALFSQLLIPRLREEFGAQVAFGIPGVLMFLATIVFWLGRNKFVHVPAGGIGFLKEAFSGEGLLAIRRLSIIYFFLIIFWSIFDQTGSAWTLQAERMDRTWMGVNWLPDEIQAANPALVMILVPLFAFIFYPAISKFFPLSPLRKISLGFFVTVTAFVLSAWIEARLDAGEVVNISWQLLAYIILTSAEILVSITCLEFSYTQAPPKMKSFIMAIYLLSISLGNALASTVNYFIDTNSQVKSWLAGPNYYLFFAGMMFIAACIFVVVAALYRGKTYVQEV